MKKVALLVIVILTLLLLVVSVNSTANAERPWWSELSPRQTIANRLMITFQNQENPHRPYPNRTRVVHLWAHPNPVILSRQHPPEQLLFGFEWFRTDNSIEALQAFLDKPEHDITLSFDGSPAVSLKQLGLYQPAFMAVPDSGPNWTWDHDGDGLGDGDGDGWGDWEGPTAFFRLLSDFVWYRVDVSFEFCVTDPQFEEPLCDTINTVWE